MNAPAAITSLWRWHNSHELDRNAPAYLVERALMQYEAERAARTLLPLGTLADGDLHAVAGAMARIVACGLAEIGAEIAPLIHASL